jgi:hypothetical protein
MAAPLMALQNYCEQLVMNVEESNTALRLVAGMR